jgi:hypothetical protein
MPGDGSTLGRLIAGTRVGKRCRKWHELLPVVLNTSEVIITHHVAVIAPLASREADDPVYKM